MGRAMGGKVDVEVRGEKLGTNRAGGSRTCVLDTPLLDRA